MAYQQDERQLLVLYLICFEPIISVLQYYFVYNTINKNTIFLIQKIFQHS